MAKAFPKNDKMAAKNIFLILFDIGQVRCLFPLIPSPYIINLIIFCRLNKYLLREKKSKLTEYNDIVLSDLVYEAGI